MKDVQLDQKVLDAIGDVDINANNLLEDDDVMENHQEIPE